METTIEFYERDVYGQTLAYVMDAGIAAQLQHLLGTKTISDDQRASITELFGTVWLQVLAPKKA